MNTDWNQIKADTSSESAEALTTLLNKYIEDCFPIKTRKAKANDVPWFNSRTRRLSNKKMRIYKKEGKSERYKRASKEYEAALKEAKEVFMEGVLTKCKKARNTKGYYKTIKMFQTKEAPVPWDIRSLYPDESDSEIAEIVADFFNTISQEYPPLPSPEREWARDSEPIIQEYEVAARIKSFKKPNSVVYGDINLSLIHI